MIKSSDIPPNATTGIGSLPYLQCAPALDSAFWVDIPYFPTLPKVEAKEGILAQALTGFPGVYWKTGGDLSFEWDAWERGREALAEKLGKSYLTGGMTEAFRAPPGGMWDLFLQRAESDSRYWFKFQLLGPVTASLALRGLETAAPELAMELVAQVSEWLFAKALAMSSELSRRGKRVLFFWDEPGLGTSLSHSPQARWALEHLQERSGELRNLGIQVGVHCCGDWDAVEALAGEWDFLSLDASVSGEGILAKSELLRAFHRRGGRLALGLVPTEPPSTWNSRQEVEQWRARFAAALGEGDAKGILAESMLTPACGLGLKKLEGSEAVFRLLQEVKIEMSRPW